MLNWDNKYCSAFDGRFHLDVEPGNTFRLVTPFSSEIVSQSNAYLWLRENGYSIIQACEITRLENDFTSEVLNASISE